MFQKQRTKNQRRADEWVRGELARISGEQIRRLVAEIEQLRASLLGIPSPDADEIARVKSGIEDRCVQLKSLGVM